MRTTLGFVVGVAVLLTASANASAAVYGGETSQAAPIAVTLAKSGQVKSIALSWIAKCGSGQRYSFGSVITAAKKPPSFMPAGQNFLFAKVSKKGRVSGTALGADNIGNGRGAAIAQKVTGKITKTSASGTWSATVNVLDGSGNKVDSCSTGSIRWSTRHGATTYGGSTTQGEPVVIITTKDRSRVGYLGFGWDSGCDPDGGVEFFEDFGNFPLTGNGSFGDTFSNDFPFDDGSGKNTFSYTIHGSLGKARGSGSLSAKLVETDAAGATQSTCDTGSVKWSVSH